MGCAFCSSMNQKSCQHKIKLYAASQLCISSSIVLSSFCCINYILMVCVCRKLAYRLIYRESIFKSSYLPNKTSHQQKLYIEKILSGALLNISSYTRIPYFRRTWQAVEVSVKLSIIGMVFYYRHVIASCTSIIGSFEYNRSLFSFSITENF